MPSWLRNFIPVTLVLILLQLMVYFLAIHRFPDYTAVLLAICLLLAAGIGLLFRERAFCSLLCPAGAVFGLYARLAPFELRVREQDVCAGCTSQRCISEPVEWTKLQFASTIVYRKKQLEGCPAGLVPSELRDSADCTLCLNCLQNCDKDNVRLGFRSWFADLFRDGLRPSETFFFMVLLGMLTANFSKVNIDLRDLIFMVPEQSAQLLGWQENGFYVLAVIWIAFLLPLLLMLPGYLVFRLGQVRTASVEQLPGAEPEMADGESEGFWTSMGRLALPLIPLVLAAHAVLALVKINAKAAYLPYAIGDPSGIKPFLAINVMQTVSAPGVLLPLDLLKWIILLVLVGGLLMSWRIGYRTVRDNRFVKRSFLVATGIGTTFLFSLYLVTVVEWLFIR